MLSSVLRSETAIAVNIKIMRTFTKIRKSVPQDSNLLNRVELIEYNQSDMRRLLLETTNADGEDMTVSSCFTATGRNTSKSTYHFEDEAGRHDRAARS